MRLPTLLLAPAIATILIFMALPIAITTLYSVLTPAQYGGVIWQPSAEAYGGMVVGPGGPREDKLLHLLSAGEFVVNAYSTAAHLPLLEAINAGVPVDRLVDLIGGRHLPALADGGLAGVGASAPGSWRNWTGGGSASTGGGPAPGAQPGSMRIALEIGMDRDGNWEARVRDIATEASGPVAQVTVEQWSRKALPGRMAQIQSDPRRVG